MTWRTTLDWQTAKQRASILKEIRHFFETRNVTEVETPLLSQGTITDVHLDAMTSRYDFLANSTSEQSTTFYLQTSPEFAMKRLLASGYGCIFQICKAFRHEGYGKHHNPEFSILEWYRLGFDHFKLMNEVGELLQCILQCDQPTQISYQDVFIKHLNIDPLIATREELLVIIDEHNKLSDWLLHEHDLDTLLQFVFCELIEPNIGKKSPCFVYNFPSSQASLAKISKEDSRVADRFECYYLGIELANGFHELTDVSQQLQRFEQDNIKRVASKLPVRPIDNSFISALENGLPQCSGVALGIDRLVMLALQIENIEQVLTFPIERA
ncbi:MAG: elongation factor P--(R)-beta-lysine ligase [Alteromonadaceae bacterium]|nr:elongation factor P--(R)-beta-lysine ligase [Alteromonadaceae bacterium]